MNSFNLEFRSFKREKAKIRINFDPAERHCTRLYLCSTRVTASIASPWKKKKRERKKGDRARIYSERTSLQYLTGVGLDLSSIH